MSLWTLLIYNWSIWVQLLISTCSRFWLDFTSNYIGGSLLTVPKYCTIPSKLNKSFCRRSFGLTLHRRDGGFGKASGGNDLKITARRPQNIWKADPDWWDFQSQCKSGSRKTIESQPERNPNSGVCSLWIGKEVLEVDQAGTYRTDPKIFQKLEEHRGRSLRYLLNGPSLAYFQTVLLTTNLY